MSIDQKNHFEIKDENILDSDNKHEFLSSQQKIKIDAGGGGKSSPDLPPPFFLLWEGIILSWRGFGTIFKLLFFPWLLASLVHAGFHIFLPKSLIYNYGLSAMMNFLIFAMAAFPIAYWCVGEGYQDKKFSPLPFLWNVHKKDFLFKMFLWLLGFCVIALGAINGVSFIFEYINGLLENTIWQNLTTIILLLLYLCLVFVMSYGLSSWLFYIPYIIFQREFKFLNNKKLYNWEFFKNEIKLIFKTTKNHHLWIFGLFVTLFFVPIIMGTIGVLLAAAVYFGSSALTAELPLFIRSNLIQVVLMSGVVMWVIFVTMAIIIIILARAFHVLYYKKSADYPIF